MTTLISAYNSEGCIGRCDAKCYEAEGPDCDCICGGRNHGQGKHQAVENTRQLASAWMTEYQQRHPTDALAFTIADDVRQLCLPI